MQAEKLPVYNATRELFLQIHRSTQKCPIDLRRGRIVAIKEKVLKIMAGITYAYLAVESRVRLHFIDETRQTLRDVEIEVRCIFDLGFLRRKSFAAIMRCEDSIARQLDGWERKTVTNEK